MCIYIIRSISAILSLPPEIIPGIADAMFPPKVLQRLHDALSDISPLRVIYSFPPLARPVID